MEWVVAELIFVAEPLVEKQNDFTVFSCSYLIGYENSDELDKKIENISSNVVSSESFILEGVPCKKKYLGTRKFINVLGDINHCTIDQEDIDVRLFLSFDDFSVTNITDAKKIGEGEEVVVVYDEICHRDESL